MQYSDTGTVRVSVVPDAWTYITVAATVAAVLLALFSIWYAAQQAQKARTDAEAAAEQGRKDAQRERRLEYELSILAEMSRQHGITGIQHLRGYALSLIRPDASDDDLPLLRHLTRIHPPQLGADKDAEIKQQASALHPNRGLGYDYAIDNERIAIVGAEIAEAIGRRLN